MNDSEDDLFKSKSQVKRELHALQDLGQALCDAPGNLRNQCNLPGFLADAVEEFRRLKSNGARKRQIQYIGKLMRELDEEEMAGIEAVLQQNHQHAEVQKRRFHRLEALRDRLVADDQGALDQLIAEQPDIDIQHLRQLIRTARREAEQGKPPSASRKLFQYLRDTDSDS